MDDKKYSHKTISIDTENELHKENNEIDREYLINKLNFANFQDKAILVNLKHKEQDIILYRHAKPQPCIDEVFYCTWTDTEDLKRVLDSYEFKDIIINDDQKLLRVEPKLIRMDKEGIRVILPEFCYETSSRKIRRDVCIRHDVQLIQAGISLKGFLVDFSYISFRVRLKSTALQTFQMINPESTVIIIISANDETLYSGECKIINQGKDRNMRNFVLEPLSDQLQRFEPKKFRSTRQELVPLPNIRFKHPLTGKMIAMNITDISCSGFSVEEIPHSSVMLPGMIIPELELSFATTSNVNCNVQVLYRNKSIDEYGIEKLKFGIAILDMSNEDQLMLSSLLHQAENKNLYVCNKIGMDSLWDFFFETGFIYPSKYKYIEANKETIKKTYEKLYSGNPNIARHFTCIKNNTILGHIAMLRFYNNTWMAHHHAARRSSSTHAGISVLNQIIRFINEFYRLNSSHMDYIFCYYRPNNLFPEHFYGGAALEIDDPGACSIDQFTYHRFSNNITEESALPADWDLVHAEDEDLMILLNHYDNDSGGLMINAMNLKPGQTNIDNISEEYKKIGLLRKRYLYSLKRNGKLKAIIIINNSDIGLNLSDLTNCINAIVLDTDGLPNDVFSSAISIIMEKFEQIETPVLIYPTAYADNHSIEIEKVYNLWILNTQYFDNFCGYIQNLLKNG